MGNSNLLLSREMMRELGFIFGNEDVRQGRGLGGELGKRLELQLNGLY